MSVLRQHTVLLDARDPVAGPSTGPVHQLTPSDGDATSDADMGFVALITLDRADDPRGKAAAAKVARPPIAALVEGSFDKVHWVRLAGVTMPPTERHLDRAVSIGAVPPFLRVRVYATNLATRFAWTAHVAIGANAPYRARVST